MDDPAYQAWAIIMFKQVGNLIKVNMVLDHVTNRYANCGKSRQYGRSGNNQLLFNANTNNVCVLANPYGTCDTSPLCSPSPHLALTSRSPSVHV